MTDWMSLDQAFIMRTVNRWPIAVERAEGNYLFDVNGKRYLDLFTGLAVNVLGHGHPRILQALEEQGKKFLHISNLFLNPPAIRLAERLVKLTLGTGKVYFAGSGAEATEAAVKLIHKWAARERNGREGIVVVKNSFHGRTLGAMRLTRQPDVYQDFPQPDFPVYEVEVNDTDQLREWFDTRRPAAFLAEPILGAGGVVSLTEEFLTTAAELCARDGALFCMDEIQTGIGRTGTLFAFQHFGLKPDLILFAKGIGGGLPLGGVIAGEKAMDAFKPGDHGTTFSPSPLSSALGNAVLDALLQDGWLEEGKRRADELWRELHALQQRLPEVFSHMDGRGMMIGIRTRLSKEQILELHRALMDDGMLVNMTAGTVIRLLPPLTLTSEEIGLFVQTLERHVRERFL
ncbi:aspartate aminotransferase family protein [Staphylospora marina]|uniref:aspartate aminotransferase family protein n=1 Tax=Staphylospora marina TaxID=2490858 RepID=UPI000F5BA528|nr:aminotransferase class III-fold pyridoxal phosphate-dependent enzyme [Staphylospora marina]